MIFDFEDLRLAWKAESRGKRSLPNQQRYRYRLEENLFALAERLNSGAFEPTPLRLKRIYYPKRRQAQVPSQEDKIVQHAIADEHAYYPMVAPLIKEASANTRGRGTDYGVKELQEQLRRFWNRHHKQPWILKCDIHHFFYSIPHGRANALIDRYIKDEAISAIMKKFVALTGRGLPLGLQQSQLLANLYLSDLDHKIKERLGFTFYGRHMDDFYILAETEAELRKALDWIREYVASIGLELNPKTAILYKSFDYLGYCFTLGDTGKVIVRLSKTKVQAKRRHLRRMARQLETGQITAEKFAASYFGWRQHAMKAKNARTQVLNIDQYTNSLLNTIGYALTVAKVNKGKVHWRVIVAPKEV